jgi:hypothetical protein
MGEENSGAAETQGQAGPVGAIRFSFRSLRAIAGSDVADVEALTEAAGEDWQTRRHVLDLLYEKQRTLAHCEGVLYALLDSTTSAADFARIDAELRDVTQELDLCRARYAQIDRGRPFAQLSRDEERRLLDAIQRVGQAVSNTNALSTLLTATHELVEAYGVSQV